MKTRILNILTVLMLCLTILTPKAGAKSPNNWYCVHTANHQRPRVDAALSYIEKYDGYYIAPEEQGKVIYLTFDAGYENGNVAKILDILKEKEVSAAFFVLSHLIEKDTALVTRMFDEGHTVCNHTAKHKDLSLADRATFEGELEDLSRVCLEKTGREMAKYYRPPEGRFSENNLKWAQEMGYRTIFWSFAYADWDNQRQMNPNKAKEKILSNVHPGEVILLHPTSQTNVLVLGEVIDECRRMGYRFGTLDELTGRA
ncbi:MAG: delta-lactam-biosynthetic de-N-acetylase [Ruminococcaceae bacterium]|nr:delta-lactam-biosynthetic de-N-acetylase [Oscillospiraceae bacterium]